MARKLNGIELTRYDDLFKTDAEREADQQERVQIVPAEQVFPYVRQPYSVDRPSADLVRLMDSIERTGIAEPLIVRPRSEGGYEIISGHRRDYCAKVVGLDTRPVIVRDEVELHKVELDSFLSNYSNPFIDFRYTFESGATAEGNSRALLYFAKSLKLYIDANIENGG